MLLKRSHLSFVCSISICGVTYVIGINLEINFVMLRVLNVVLSGLARVVSFELLLELHLIGDEKGATG